MDMNSSNIGVFPFETKWNRRDHYEMLELCKSWLGHGNILDIGCGRGESTSFLDAVGFELRRFSTWSLLDANFLVADGVHLPFRESIFDGVFINNVLEHIPEKKGLISELYRVAKQNSTYVFILPTPKWKIYKFIDLPKNFVRILRGYEPIDWWVHASNVYGLNWFSEYDDFRNWDKFLSEYFHIDERCSMLNGFQLLFKCSGK